MTTTSTRYVFDPRWQKERDRLRSLEALFDRGTTRHLTELGIGPGRRCLEVGAGAGGVAHWMARAVGREGQVVATDLDPRFVMPEDGEPLEVRRHDILTDPLETAWFDLAHARAVVEHVADKALALERIVTAVRPGGRVLIEDVDFGGPTAATLARYVHPPEARAATERIYRAVEAVFAAVGADASFGPQLPGLLEAAGLEDVGAESRAIVASAATERWARGTIEQLRDRLTETGLTSDEEIDAFLTVADEPGSHYAPPFMVSAWGRRPA